MDVSFRISPVPISPNAIQSLPHLFERKSTHTNKRQPDKLKANQRHNCQQHPQHRLRIQRQPKEALIRRINLAPRLWIQALEYPAPVPCVDVDFVPPAQPDEAPPRDVLEVVEVDCEQQDGDDEDQDEVGGQETQAQDVYEEGCWGGVS
jgi:hypothetical protein